MLCVRGLNETHVTFSSRPLFIFSGRSQSSKSRFSIRSFWIEEASLFVHTDHPHRNERGSMFCINQTTIVSLAISIVLLPVSGDKYSIFIYYIVYRVSFWSTRYRRFYFFLICSIFFDENRYFFSREFLEILHCSGIL